MIKLNGPDKTLQLKTEIFIFMTEHFSGGEYLSSSSSSVIWRQIGPFNPVLSGRKLQDCGHWDQLRNKMLEIFWVLTKQNNSR